MSNSTTTETQVQKPKCIGDFGKCPFPVLAKRRCEAHYQRHRRGGSDDAPVLEYRGELVEVNTRITKEAAAELKRAGGAYSVGAKILEAWAAEHRAKRLADRGSKKGSKAIA